MGSHNLYSLEDLKAALPGIPPSQSTRFQDASKRILGLVANPYHLHIFHVIGTREELLLLRMALIRIRVSNKNRRSPVLVIVEANQTTAASSDAAESVAELIKDVAGGQEPVSHGERVKDFGGVFLVVNRAGAAPERFSGRDYLSWQSEQKDAVEDVISVSKSLCDRTEHKSCIWHNWLWLPMLSYVLARSVHRPAIRIAAITINGALQMDEHSIKARDSIQLQAILTSAQRLGVDTVLFDASTLQNEFRAFHQYPLPDLDVIWPALLPLCSWSPTVKAVFDELCIYIFRLRAAISGIAGHAVARKAAKILSAPSAGKWGNLVFSPDSYSSKECSLRRSTSRLPWLVRFCACPLYDESFALQGLVVNPCGPTSELLAVPVAVHFEPGTYQSLSLDPDGNTYILVPRSKSRLETSMLSFWEDFVHSMRRNHSHPKVPKAMAQAWKDLSIAMCKQLTAIMRESSDQRIFRKEEKMNMAQALDALENGPFTTICKMSI